MDSWTRTYLGSLFVVLALIGVVPAQDSLVEDNLDLTDVIVDVESSVADTTEAPVADNSGDVVRVVRLKSDGKLSGRVSIIQATGKRLPADAQLKFQRDGELVEEATTNEDGQFEVVGIDPGTYVATASIDSGSTDFSVNVLPYDANAEPEQMMLDATLTPTPEMYYDEGIGSACSNCGGEVIMDQGIVDGGYVDGGYVDGGIIGGGEVVCDSCMGGEIISDQYVGEQIIGSAPCSMGATTCSSGFSGGGGSCCGGGGGRGLGWLLGVGGLAAGITALAIDNDDAPASPAGP